jgi:hypothetical protein
MGLRSIERPPRLMAKTSKTKKAKPKPISPEVANLELVPDAWPKFERLVKSAAKLGPKPHNERKPR